VSLILLHTDIRLFNIFVTSHACRAYERGGSASTLVRGLESQDGACESLKGPIAIDVLFWFFHFLGYFQLKFTILREISACTRVPKAVLFRLAKFLLKALHARHEITLICVFPLTEHYKWHDLLNYLIFKWWFRSSAPFYIEIILHILQLLCHED